MKDNGGDRFQMLGRLTPEGSRSEALSVSALVGVVPSGPRWAGIAAASFGLLVGGFFAAQVTLFTSLSPAALSSSVARVSEPLRPGAPLTVSVSGFGTAIEDARLFRTEIAPDGTATGREQPVKVRLEREGESWRVLSADPSPLLRPDGAYRLEVRAAAPSPSLPLPRQESVIQQYRFTTVEGPRVTLPAEGQRRLRWGESVPLAWNLPMESVIVVTQPQVPTQVWVDGADRTRISLRIGGEGGASLPAAGGTYDVAIMQARSVDGLEIQQPATFNVTTPPRPRLSGAPPSSISLSYGEGITLTSSVPLAEARVEADGQLGVEARVDGSVLRVGLPSYEQGQVADVRIMGATSLEGAPLLEPVRFRISTPDPFAAPRLEPQDGLRSVEPSSRPRVTFAGPVLNRAAAERSLRLDPEVAGRWNWMAPDVVEFVPQGRLPFLTEFTLTVGGGPEGVRGMGGGFLEEDATSSFRTTHYKVIDVNVNRQVLTRFEDGKQLDTILVATGVPGADTPIGTFQVEYKMPRARFRGVNPSGLRYDIDDVNWVLAFMGDYTIHGAYWRGQFGTPGSNGCVSMTDADAKRLFDWADEGTVIKIHY